MVLEQRRVILSPREPLLYGRFVHDWSKRPFSQLMYGRFIHDWSKRPFSQVMQGERTVRENILSFLRTRPLLIQRTRLVNKLLPSTESDISIDSTLGPYTYTKTIGDISVTQD